MTTLWDHLFHQFKRLVYRFLDLAPVRDNERRDVVLLRADEHGVDLRGQIFGPAVALTDVEAAALADDSEHLNRVIVTKSLLRDLHVVVDREDIAVAEVRESVENRAGAVGLSVCHRYAHRQADVRAVAIISVLCLVVFRYRNYTEGRVHITLSLIHI